jgi:glycosyltransferase involved in cell wall biosynthesis
MKIAVIADYNISPEVEKQLGDLLAPNYGRSTPTGTINLSRGLARTPGVELHHIFPLSSLKKDITIEVDNLNLHLLRVPPRVTSLSLLQYPRKRINRVLARIRPDVVHGHHAETGYPYYAITSNYPALAGVHNYIPSLIKLNQSKMFSTMKLYSLVESYTFRKSKYITVDSRWMEDLVRSKSKASVFRIPNCVHELFFEQENHVETGHPSLVFVGVIRPEKGLATLLRSMSIIRQKYPEVVLKIIGDSPRQLQEEADKILDDLDLSHNVRFLGWMGWREMREEMSRAWVLVVPSTYEPFGCTVVEGMALGKPVVGSNVGGIAENISDGENGLLFQAGNAADLADRVQTLLDSANDRKRLGEQAAATARSLWHPDVVAQQHLRLYEQILADEIRN